MEQQERQLREAVGKINSGRKTVHDAVEVVLEAWKDAAFRMFYKKFDANALIAEIYYEDFAAQFKTWVMQNHQSVQTLADLKLWFDEALKDYTVRQGLPQKGRAGLMKHFHSIRSRQNGSAYEVTENEFLAALILSQQYKNVFLVILFDVLQLNMEEVIALLQQVVQEHAKGQPHSLDAVMKQLRQAGYGSKQRKEHRLFQARSFKTQLSKAWSELFHEALEIHRIMNGKKQNHG